MIFQSFGLYFVYFALENCHGWRICSDSLSPFAFGSLFYAYLLMTSVVVVAAGVAGVAVEAAEVIEGGVQAANCRERRPSTSSKKDVN